MGRVINLSLECLHAKGLLEPEMAALAKRSFEFSVDHGWRKVFSFLASDVFLEQA